MMRISNQIHGYLDYCKNQKGLSSNTIRAYNIDMQQFLTFLDQQGLSGIYIGEIGKEIIQSYIDHLVAIYSPRSCKRKIACIKAFFNHLEFEDIIPISPFRKLRIKIREPRMLPKLIKKKEAAAQLKYVYGLEDKAKTNRQRFYALRTVAIYELLFATGLRVGELCRLRLNDFDYDNRTIRIFGKGKKERVVYLVSDKVINALLSYMENRICNSEYFFVNWNGSQMREERVRSIVHEIALTTVHHRITPHMFRHTFATMLLENNTDICYIQALLGHSSIKTTQIYLHLSNSTIRAALLQARLRERLFET